LLTYYTQLIYWWLNNKNLLLNHQPTNLRT
jgi:hypothetical protein